MDRRQYERDLAERRRKHLQMLEDRGYQRWKPCAHDQCQNCHGTGLGLFGPCVHSLYCDCPKCGAYYLTTTSKGGE